MPGLSFLVENGWVKTRGLASIGRPELRVRVRDGSSVEETRKLLGKIAAHIVSVNSGFRPGDELHVDGRLVRFGAAVDGALELSVFADPAFDVGAGEDAV